MSSVLLRRPLYRELREIITLIKRDAGQGQRDENSLAARNESSFFVAFYAPLISSFRYIFLSLKIQFGALIASLASFACLALLTRLPELTWE